MKVVAFSGSARKNGNTALLLRTALAELEAEGIETELVQLAGTEINGCIACYQCFQKKDGRCAVEKDCINDCLEKMKGADAILLGSPTYFADVSTEMKALMDRCGMVSRANDDMFKRKLGAAVVAARRAGAIHVFDTMNHFFLIGQMIVIGSNYWNIGMGREKEEVAKDEEGMNTMKVLGQNMAWALKQMAS
ncbi:multimeric flavodoxin WrbA [Desulfocapsa sulfexigens DSM 10523]|uniref:Multimeric flavodoxin WrbA n=1 Tax=Desulfocapsa sulfexigens (strain DSM 10523 / SB164P1) TaxID=1167006 RepID=M1P9B3_DESSD|nr:multimeric flavodoxin WrbA [Desulfocapsa sulfexigens DSM 10523]